MWHSQASILLLVALHIHGVLAPTFRNFVTSYPHAFPCVLHLKNEEGKKKNEAFLPSEKEESQTLTRALILSSNAHNEASYLSLHHGRIQECKKGEKNSKFIAKTCNLHLTQAHSTYSLTRLDLTWQEYQAKKEAPHLGAFVFTSKIHPFTSK